MLEQLIDLIQSECVSDASVTVAADTPLVSSGIVDSFSLVSLQRLIQKRLGMTVPNDIIVPDRFDTARELLVLVQTYGRRD